MRPSPILNSRSRFWLIIGAWQTSIFPAPIGCSIFQALGVWIMGKEATVRVRNAEAEDTEVTKGAQIQNTNGEMPEAEAGEVARRLRPLEHFHQSCSDELRSRGPRSFRLSASFRPSYPDASGRLRRRPMIGTTRRKPKIPAAHRYIFSVNALD